MRLNKHMVWSALVLAGVLGLASTAQARPLSLFELAEFNAWVQCAERCGELPPSPTFEQ